MSNQAGIDFFNSLLSSLSQSANQDNDVVVKANFEIRMADPKKVEPIARSLREDEDEREPAAHPVAPLPPNTGVTAGTRVPEVVAVPSTSPAPQPGPRVNAATRQTHYYNPPEQESPELLPNNGRQVTDYNPEYQNQFDHYLRTRKFDEMYRAAVQGYGSPAPRTPY